MFLITLLAAVFATTAQASNNDKQYQTLAEVRASGVYHLTCATIADQPTINFTFHSNLVIGPGMQSASMAVVWPKEGLLVRDWPALNPQFSGWSVTGDATEMIISNSLFSSGEVVTLTVEDSTNGRFKSYLRYYYNTTPVQKFEREVRCYANNYYPGL